MVVTAPWVSVTAQWTLAADGYMRGNETLLRDLARRLAALVVPGYDPPATRQSLPDEDRDSLDDMGVWQTTRVERWGDERAGLRITNHITEYNDGVTPMAGATTIEVVGLPPGCALVLHGSHIAPVYGRPNPVLLEALLPAALVGPITRLLTTAFGATITTAVPPLPTPNPQARTPNPRPWTN